MAKDIFRRYIWLVDVIRRAKDGITFEQINDKWKRSSLNDTGEDLPKRRQTSRDNLHQSHRLSARLR